MQRSCISFGADEFLSSGTDPLTALRSSPKLSRWESCSQQETSTIPNSGGHSPLGGPGLRPARTSRPTPKYVVSYRISYATPPTKSACPSFPVSPRRVHREPKARLLLDSYLKNIPNYSWVTLASICSPAPTKKISTPPPLSAPPLPTNQHNCVRNESIGRGLNGSPNCSPVHCTARCS
jgi:hypothetical protein